MLSSLLAQFRHRFPQGSLTPELLTIHDGQYVVRVCVALEGTPLACALGADPSLEAAEDRATSRALQRLGLAAEPSADAEGAPVARLPLAPAAAKATIPERVIPPIPAPERAMPKLAAPEMGIPEMDIPETAVPELTSVELAPPAPLERVSPQPLAVPPAPGIQSVAPAPSEPADLAADLDHPGGPVIPIDLSDIIAQTDVELQRLGWGVNQGREFLEKTYSKRSRHDLTDDELLEFLLYLETQSAPSPPAGT